MGTWKAYDSIRWYAFVLNKDLLITGRDSDSQSVETRSY